MPLGGTDGSGASLQVFPKDNVFRASDTTPIAYAHVDTGDGAPILFANGWSCPDAYWSRVAWGLIGRGHPAVVPSLRGLGPSGLPRAAGFAGRNLRHDDLSIERLGLDLIELLDAAGVERAVLMGHSMSVQIILEAYRHAPDRVLALVAVAGTFRNPVATFANLPVLDRLYPWADAVFRRIPLGGLRALAPFVPAWLVHAGAVSLGVGSHRLNVADMAAHAAQLTSSNPSVLWRITSSLRHHDAGDLLSRIHVPTLILAGRLDYFMPPEVQEEMHRRIPESELVWFEDGTHLLPVDDPVRMIGATADFLRRRV